MAEQRAEWEGQRAELREESAAFEELQKQFREETSHAEPFPRPDWAPLRKPPDSRGRRLLTRLGSAALFTAAAAAGYAAVWYMQSHLSW